MTLAELEDRWERELAGEPVTVVLPESGDPRVIAAAARLAHLDGVIPMLVGNPTDVSRVAGEAGVGLPAGLSIVEPEDLLAEAGVRSALEGTVLSHGSGDPGSAALESDPLYVAAATVAAGYAGAAVAGATRPSGEVIRAGIRVIGLAAGSRWVTSCFLMVMPDGRAFCFGDCAVIPEPDAAQLAEIASASAATFEVLTGEAARVAFLSFSTKGSAVHPRVEVVRSATRLAAERLEGVVFDGELQADAALAPGVAAIKAPGSPVAGLANVLVFPDLGSGNIAYKLAERLAGARAIGPVIQGLAGSMHDLSRGAGVEEVVSMVRVAAVLARRRVPALAAGAGS